MNARAPISVICAVDRYNQVATAIGNDPEKRDKTVELINQIVSS